MTNRPPNPPFDAPPTVLDALARHPFDAKPSTTPPPAAKRPLPTPPAAPSRRPLTPPPATLPDALPRHHRPSRSEKRAVAKRATIVAAARAEVTDSALWGTVDHRALTADQASLRPSVQRATRAARPHWTPPPLARLVAGTLVAVCGMVVLSVGLPLQHHSTRPVWLIGGAAAVALGAWLLKSTRSRVNLPARIATTAIMLLVGLSLVVGTLDSVVIRGQVAPDTSTAARAYRLSNSLTTDMYTLAAADHLITANQSTARADYQSYATAQADLSGISKHWLIVATGPQPTAAFSTIETTLGNAAYWEADAVTKKAQDVVTPDSTVESEIASDRTTYTNQLLAAGTALQQLAQLYGYKLVTNQAQNG